MNDTFIKRHRTTGSAALIALVLSIASLWSLSRFFNAREAAALAASDTEACRYMADRIEQLEKRASAAGAGSMNQTDLHRRGQEALARLGMPPGHLLQVSTEAPRRVRETAYKDVPSQFILQNVTLRQLVSFLLYMTGDRSVLQVRNLRLHSPNDGLLPDGARWSAEVTLSYMIYEPPTAVNLARMGDQ